MVSLDTNLNNFSYQKRGLGSVNIGRYICPLCNEILASIRSPIQSRRPLSHLQKKMSGFKNTLTGNFLAPNKTCAAALC